MVRNSNTVKTGSEVLFHVVDILVSKLSAGGILDILSLSPRESEKKAFKEPKLECFSRMK